LKTIETLVPYIKKLFEGHTLEEHLATGFANGLADMFVRRFKEYGEDDKDSLRLSNIGWPTRKLWYSVKGYKGTPLAPEDKVKFLYGDVLESLFVFLAIQAGHSVTDLQQEVEIEGVKGHIDCIIDGVLVDVKSCSTFSYAKFVNGGLYDNDPFGYIAQLSAYKQATKASEAGWLIIDKTHGNFQYVRMDRGQRNVSMVKHTGIKIQPIKDVLNQSKEPERCYTDKPNDKSGNRILDIGCQYCPYKIHCWRDCNEGRGLQERFYSNGVRYFTKLLKEPKLKSQSDTFITDEQFPTRKLKE